jgi:hypothetical protein
VQCFTTFTCCCVDSDFFVFHEKNMSKYCKIFDLTMVFLAGRVVSIVDSRFKDAFFQ